MKRFFSTIYTSPAKTLRAFCLFFLLGVALATPQRILLLEWEQVVFCVVIFLLVGVLFFWKRTLARFVFLILFGAGVGAFLVLQSTPQCERLGEICHYAGSDANIVGIIHNIDETKNGATVLVRVSAINDVRAKERNLMATFSGAVAAKIGDEVSFECTIRVPSGENDRFRRATRFLEQNIGGSCTKPGNFVVVKKSGPTVLRILKIINRGVGERISALWRGADGALMAGLLYGAQSDLPNAVKNNFSRAGLSHIIAVSGFNVTVVASALIGMALASGLRRGSASYAALGAVWLFVFFAGGTASAVRAGAMATVALLGERLGRLGSAGPALLFASVIMVALNPFTLLYNIGFQLSVLATAGLIYGSPIVEESLGRLSFFRTNDLIREVLATTLAATTATLPIILYYFGRVSPLGVVANILVVPYLPLLMLLGAVALAASLVFAPLAAAIANLAHAGLRYVLGVAFLFGNPRLSFTIFLPLPATIILYIVLVYYVQKKSARL